MEQFGGQSEWKKAASLNLLANAARINDITNKLRTMNTTTDEGKIMQAFYIGKLLRILLIFDAPNISNADDDLDIEGLDDLYDEHSSSDTATDVNANEEEADSDLPWRLLRDEGHPVTNILPEPPKASDDQI